MHWTTFNYWKPSKHAASISKWQTGRIWLPRSRMLRGFGLLTAHVPNWSSIDLLHPPTIIDIVLHHHFEQTQIASKDRNVWAVTPCQWVPWTKLSKTKASVGLLCLLLECVDSPISSDICFQKSFIIYISTRISLFRWRRLLLSKD